MEYWTQYWTPIVNPNLKPNNWSLFYTLAEKTLAAKFLKLFGNLIHPTPKRMYLLIWNFLAFPKYQKQKFWKNLNCKFVTPIPRLVVESRLQNMIFRANKKRTKSKRWPLYLKSYRNFVQQGCVKSHFHQILKSENLAQFPR